MSILGPSPSFSITPGLKGSIKTSALEHILSDKNTGNKRTHIE
jgi:hypothetical protein